MLYLLRALQKIAWYAFLPLMTHIKIIRKIEPKIKEIVSEKLEETRLQSLEEEVEDPTFTADSETPTSSLVLQTKQTQQPQETLAQQQTREQQNQPQIQEIYGSQRDNRATTQYQSLDRTGQLAEDSVRMRDTPTLQSRGTQLAEQSRSINTLDESALNNRISPIQNEVDREYQEKLSNQKRKTDSF